MEVRVERARRVDGYQAVFLPELGELLANDEDALPEVALEILRPGVRDGPLEVVEDREEVVREPGERDLEVLLPLALRALLVVLELGELAQVPVAQVVEVLLRGSQPVLGCREGTRLLLGSGIV